MSLHAHRGSILHFLADPGAASEPTSYEFFEDGLLLIENGKVVRIGPARPLLQELPPALPVTMHAGKLLLPGFIDPHIHYPQTDVIGSGGHNLLEWLRDYTFPAEQRFNDVNHARAVAEFFLDELARNGTTTAMVYCTVHPESAEAFFEAAAARNLRMIAGKVLMDRHCPAPLQDSAASGELDSRKLIERWHRRDRLLYAITPRFAPTSTDAQLQSVGRLAREFPDTFIQTHAAENADEIAWVRELHPQARSYMDVYEGFGMLRERAIYAHCIHVDDEDRRRLAQTGAGIAFCPSSNLYLGSGLFDIDAADAAGAHFAIATDVGGGNDFSMLRTLCDAYKVAQMRGQQLPPLRAFYLATRGAARILGLEQQIGSFTPGCEADFVVLDPGATALLARRWAQSRTLSEKLLLLIALGDSRVVSDTYILGQRARFSTFTTPR